MQNPFPDPISGQRIGLLGGSFDPPHEGHLHISRQALEQFGLEQVWWMVTPGNPLKEKGPAKVSLRVQACLDLVSDPRILVTDVETQLKTLYTAATLQALLARYPSVRFVWLMGSDCLVEFHRWKNWEQIMETVPIGVLLRSGTLQAAQESPAALRYGAHRVREQQAKELPFRGVPAWCLLEGPIVDLSSTQIRARGDWDVFDE